MYIYIYIYNYMPSKNITGKQRLEIMRAILNLIKNVVPSK